MRICPDAVSAGGYTFNTDEEGLSLGSGVKVDLGSATVLVDYAYVAFGVFDAVHMFLLGCGCSMACTLEKAVE